MILCGPVVEYTRHHGFCGFTGQTNNTTELSAFAEHLSFLLDRGSIPANAGVRLFYDCMFAASVNLGVTHRQRVHVDDSVQFGSQVYSHAASDANSGCKSSSGQGKEKA